MKVVLLHVTGLHLGYIGCYGNDWVSTPALDWLAADSVVFDQHYADCPGQSLTAWTGKYQYSWLAAKAPTPSGLHDVLAAQGIPLIRITEAQLTAMSHINPDSYHEEVRQSLRSALDGMGDAASWLIWLELPTLLPPWLVGEEFLVHYFQPDQPESAESEDTEDEDDDADEDDAETIEEEPEPEEAPPAEEPDAPDEEEVPGILWPLLDPPLGIVDMDNTELLERLHLSYTAAVSQTDAYLQTALEQLQAQGLLDDILLIVTSDRGLALGEHGVVGDAKPWLHDELIHLPLLIRLPRAEQAGRRVPALTQPVDLFPTLLEAFGIAPPAHHGHSLFPLLRATATKVRDYACAGLKLDQDAEWVLRTPEWAVLLPADETGSRRAQLFAKPEDRWEVNNLRQHHLDLAERLEQTLREWAKATAQPGQFVPPELELIHENRGTQE